MTRKFPLEVRRAFETLPLEAAHIATREPRWAGVFMPSDHQGALDPDRTVVVGDRGTGKSFWTSVLISNNIRNLVAKRYPRLRLDAVEGELGFSDAEMAAGHPAPAQIQAIMNAGYQAEDLWRAVLLRSSPFPAPGSPEVVSDDWKPVVDWVSRDPGKRNGEFRNLDRQLASMGKTYVLVFDALDVIADNWTAVRTQLEGLIKLSLALRALQSIRIKLFIRPDMADDRRLWEVGDASKLRHSEVPLVWGRRDLYGLLWTLLANSDDAPAGKSFRRHCERISGAGFEYQDNSWRPLRQLVDDEERQQKIFHALAGEYMGAGPRKGDTYKWVTNHLSDAGGFAAPRSFLLAMRQAASETKSQETVLDKTGIESGARNASRVRVDELSEDYRWMGTVLKGMEGLVVPMTERELTGRWRQQGTLDKLRIIAESENRDRRFIPPGDVLEAQDSAAAHSKLIEQLVRLKIFFKLSDGRINMPDLFRLQANVRRRGGMKPRT